MARPLYAQYDTPFGGIVVVADEQAIQAVIFKQTLSLAQQELRQGFPDAVEASSGWPLEAVRQLREFFSAERHDFLLPLDLSGCSDFTRKVLEALSKVPYATTISYGEMARQIGSPHAARAIGRVMAANRWPLVLPCHRVVGGNGQLTGYSGGGGVSTKLRLLEFESSHRMTCSSG